MAGTGVNASGSTQYVAQKSKDANRSALAPQDLGAKKRYVKANILQSTTTGTGALGILAPNDEVNLCEIPAGAQLLLQDSTILLQSTLGVGTTISLGNRAYTKNDGTVVADDTDSIVTAILGTVTTIVVLNTIAKGVGAEVPTGMGVVPFDSRGPVVVYAKFLGGAVVGITGQTIAFQFCYIVD